MEKIPNEKLEMALKYAKMGWAIVPAIGKFPCVKWKKFQKIRPTEDQIREFWTKYPRANIAVITGQISGILVFDIDSKHGRTPEEFDLPDTVVSQTANLGWHYFFKHPGYEIKNSAGKLFGVGIDIRANSGIAILPPSDLGPNKSYAWITGPTDGNIAPMPKWLEDKILEDQKTLEIVTIGSNSEIENTHRINEFNFTEILEGTRNDRIAKLAGMLLPKFKPSEWMSVVLPVLASINATSCKPPLQMSEVRNTFDSISKSEMLKTGKIGGGPIEILTARELKEISFPEAKWAVEGLFESGGLNMISAAPNQYKSWVTLQIAICLAKGEKLFGYFGVTQQSVLIINEEDQGSLVQDRMNMLEPDWTDLNIHFGILNCFQLNENSVNEILERCKILGVTFVVFDSLRSIHLADENNSTAMQEVMNHLKILSTAGITVLFTHHNRKKSAMNRSLGGAEETRGSSSINAAIYGHISLEKRKDKDTGSDFLIISHDKVKRGKILSPFRVLIGGVLDSISFTYDGEYDQVKSNTKKEEEIITCLKSINKWLTIDDLMGLGIGKEKTLRESIKPLVVEKKVMELEGKYVKSQCLEVLDSSKSIHHNTKYYSLADEESETDF